MPKHPDFVKIEKRFISQFGEDKGSQLYNSWLQKKGYDDSKPLKQKKGETKERLCAVQGFEIKETEAEFYVSGLIATTHIDEYDQEDGTVGIPDKITEETIDYWISNSDLEKMICGIHHSEGRTGEYGGKAVTLRKVDLPDGEKGLFAETKILKDDPIGFKIKEGFEKGDLTAFSITYDTQGMSSVDFDFIDDKLVRILQPGTHLFGYTAASNPVNPNALALGYGYKEFKQFTVNAGNTVSQQKNSEEQHMTENDLQKILEAKEAQLREKEKALEAREQEAKEKELKEKFEKE